MDAGLVEYYIHARIRALEGGDGFEKAGLRHIGEIAEDVCTDVPNCERSRLTGRSIVGRPKPVLAGGVQNASSQPDGDGMEMVLADLLAGCRALQSFTKEAVCSALHL